MVVLVVLPVVTAFLVPRRAEVSLATPVLIVLVVGAALGGLRVGLPSAVAGVLVLNWFFTLPYGTLEVHHPEQLLVLLVYLAVACCVSLVVGLAARRTAEADRARAEARALSLLAGAALAEAATLPSLLEQVRTVFGVREAALLELDGDAWSQVESVAGAGPVDPHEVELRVQAGPRLALQVRGPALFGEDQRVLQSFAQAAATALQGRRLSERAAEAARFEAADRLRTALLAAVGHDLRTPLSGIKAAVGTLRQDDVTWTPQEIRDLLATIEESADRLQHLVANLLDASRLQAGVVSAALEPVPLEEVVDRAMLALSIQAGHVRVQLPEDLPMVLTDVGLAERVVANLVDNAVRFSPPDRPVLVRGTWQEGAVVCEVVDHGPGVDPALRGRLFAPFQHGGDRRPGGLGLGLSVARGFADAIGATIEDAPTEGGGLTMRLRLPVAARTHQ